MFYEAIKVQFMHVYIFWDVGCCIVLIQIAKLCCQLFTDICSQSLVKVKIKIVIHQFFFTFQYFVHMELCDPPRSALNPLSRGVGVTVDKLLNHL